MSIDFVQVLDNTPVGSVVSELENINNPTLASNPGNLFSLNQDQISLAFTPPLGETSITIIDSAGDDIIITYDTISAAPVWTPGELPFSRTSQINLPLVSGTLFTPCQWSAVNPGLIFATVKYSLDIPLPTAPVCTFLANLEWFSPPAQGPISLLMTSGFTGNGDGTDNEAMSLQPNGLLVSLFNFTRTSDTTALDTPLPGQPFSRIGYAASPNILKSSGFGDPFPGLGQGVVGSGSSNLCGALSKLELLSGTISHALLLIFLIDFCNPGYVAPAINGDGHSANGFAAEGNFLAIPPGTTQPAGLSAYGVAMFNALVTYGAFNCDTGGIFGVYLYNIPSVANGIFTSGDLNTLALDTRLLFPLLQKVGYVLDGISVTDNFNSVTFPFEVCSPQVQTKHNLNNLLTITRDSDSAVQGIPSSGPPLGAIVQSAISSFCSGTTGRVSSYIGQLGVANFNSGGSAAPIMYQSGAFKTIGGLPAMAFDGSTNWLQASANWTPPFSSNSAYANVVCQIADYAANYALIGGNASGALELRIDATTGFLHLLTNTGTSIGSSGALYGALPLNTPLELGFSFVSGTSWALYLNGATIASGSTAVTCTFGYKPMIGNAGPTSTDLFKGLIGHFGIHMRALSVAQFSLEQQLIKLWGATAIGTIITKDSFVDTNGTLLPAHTMDLGSGWTNVFGSHDIQSNSAVLDTTGSTIGANVAMSVTTGAANGTYTILVTGYNAGGTAYSIPGIIFRYANSTNYWFLQIAYGFNAVQLFEVVNGFANLQKSVSLTLTSGTQHAVKLIISGANISFSIDGGTLTTFHSDSFELTQTTIGLLSILGVSPPAQCFYNNLLFTNATS